MSRLLALNPGANQYTCLIYSAKKCLIAAAAAGDITTTVNRGRQPRPMSNLRLLDVYGLSPSLLRLVFGCMNVRTNYQHQTVGRLYRFSNVFQLFSLLQQSSLLFQMSFAIWDQYCKTDFAVELWLDFDA